jgi:hypothetical protein
MTSSAGEKAFLRVAVAAIPRVAELISEFPPDGRPGALEAAERCFLAAALEYSLVVQLTLDLPVVVVSSWSRFELPHTVARHFQFRKLFSGQTTFGQNQAPVGVNLTADSGDRIAAVCGGRPILSYTVFCGLHDVDSAGEDFSHSDTNSRMDRAYFRSASLRCQSCVSFVTRTGCAGATLSALTPAPIDWWPAPTVMSDRSDEETSEPLIADHRNYYKVEKWTKDGKVERMLYAGSSLSRAQSVFDAAIRHRPRIRLTIRQRTRVPDEWPRKMKSPSPPTASASSWKPV